MALPDSETKALALLHKLTGNPDSIFCSDQLETILGLVEDRSRMLLVQRTGWGKSAVYFIATQMLRDRGAGTTLLVSPLLALMRNQIEAAKRMGLAVETINSANFDEWEKIIRRLKFGSVDLLLISPERLANPQFRSEVLPEVCRRSGLLVIDEAHCISDWGHDFRPDYRRLVRVLDLLPYGVPVLCCTATANNRVVEDISSQLGDGLALVRGPLAREGLRLATLQVPEKQSRLAWLSENIPKLPGTGIVYCLTIPDTEQVAAWLQANGVDAVAYYGATDPEERIRIEQALLSNELKVVVATSALGMGFDKSDLAFVIHYQSPGSPIAYYQQVGRAGRGLPESRGILLSGSEDREIQDYFISSAFPEPNSVREVLDLLEKRSEPMKMNEIEQSVNVRRKQLESLLKILEVEGAVEREGTGWQRTLNPWTYDHDRAESVTAQRRIEQRQMEQYIQATGCRGQLLRGFLDDPAAERCGICDNCSEAGFELSARPSEGQPAVDFLRSVARLIKPRKQLPKGPTIAAERRLEVGRALAVWGDGDWARLVQSGKQNEGRFDEELVGAARDLIKLRWCPDPAPTWVTYVPSLRNPGLVPDFAQRLATSLGLPCKNIVMKVRETEPQKKQQNSQYQYANVRKVFEISGSPPGGPVLLVDDIVDSRWTMTAIAWKLRVEGVSHVYPFALADTSGKN